MRSLLAVCISALAGGAISAVCILVGGDGSFPIVVGFAVALFVGIFGTQHFEWAADRLIGWVNGRPSDPHRPHRSRRTR